MPEQKRILVLTADVGFGHRAAANAIATALDDSCSDSCIIEIVNSQARRRAWAPRFEELLGTFDISVTDES